MERQVILNSKHFELTLNRLCYQLIETHNDFSNSVLIGLQPRGVNVVSLLNNSGIHNLHTGKLDTTFFRDDFRRNESTLNAKPTEMEVSIESKDVVLIDDVLFTGRSIRSAIDALMAFGRPKSVELLTLIDRRFKRDLPIQADYIGKTVDTLISERVSVEWNEIEGEDKVVLFTPEANG